MAEPASSIATAGVVAATVALAAWLSQLDPGAVAGAFAGAVTFALTAKDTARVPRIIYALVSLVVGYAAVPDVTALSPLKVPFLAAFVVSALVIQVTITALDRIKTASIKSVWDAVASTFRKGG
ncbi:putative holin [Castellaniella sp.]|uniref:putative holin n=1 Tax=Castellaniella sp. TaxID=1955812 RepID=UPI003A91DE02